MYFDSKEKRFSFALGINSKREKELDELLEMAFVDCGPEVSAQRILIRIAPHIKTEGEAMYAGCLIAHSLNSGYAFQP